MASRQFASASRTRRLDSDVVKVLVEDRAALRASQAGGHPLTNQFVRQLEKVNHIQRQIPLVETIIERFGLAERSMGMTGDLEAAVAEGATIVRIGTALFGSRPPAGDRPPIGEAGVEH